MPKPALQKLIDWYRVEYPRLHHESVQPTPDLAINLGCGRRPIFGFHNVDLVPGPGVETVADLNERLPFDDASAGLIYADNVFEHIENYLGLLAECGRVLRPDGRLVIDVPYFRSAGAFIDPTHRNFFTLRSMRYFVPGTYESTNYAYLPVLFSKSEVIVNPQTEGIFSATASMIANARPEVIEDSLIGRMISIVSLRFVLSR